MGCAEKAGARARRSQRARRIRIRAIPKEASPQHEGAREFRRQGGAYWRGPASPARIAPTHKSALHYQLGMRW